MNKIEYNPRKSRHIKYLERRIVELHQEIFDEALFVATSDKDYDYDISKHPIESLKNLIEISKFEKGDVEVPFPISVSYTHLTLPTKRIV